MRVLQHGAVVYSQQVENIDSVLFSERKNNGMPDDELHECVDLGLSVKWATCNVGAEIPEQFGHYFAWGENDSKNLYTWANYKFIDNGKFTKYDSDSVENILLDSIDDVATCKWGNNWRMPTDDEWHELRNQCKWIWTTINGVAGYRVLAQNGNSIFLPAAGYKLNQSTFYTNTIGVYWSSNLLSTYPQNAYNLYFDAKIYNRNGSDRFNGQSVRPVLKP